MKYLYIEAYGKFRHQDSAKIGHTLKVARMFKAPEDAVFMDGSNRWVTFDELPLEVKTVIESELEDKKKHNEISERKESEMRITKGTESVRPQLDIMKFTRGSLWWYTDNIVDKRMAPRGILRGDRIVLIFSAVSNYNGSCTVMCLPISKCESCNGDPEKLKRFYNIPINTTDRFQSYVCCNQPMPINTCDLGSYMGQIAPDKLVEIEEEYLRYLEMTNYIANRKKSTKEIKKSEQAEKLHKPAIVKFPLTYSVACPETGKVYKSVAEAAEATDIQRMVIYRNVDSGKYIDGKRFYKVSTLFDKYQESL